MAKYLTGPAIEGGDPGAGPHSAARDDGRRTAAYCPCRQQQPDVRDRPDDLPLAGHRVPDLGPPLDRVRADHATQHGRDARLSGEGVLFVPPDSAESVFSV